MNITRYDVSKSTWHNPNIEYLFNAEIIEYDLQNAGLNIIKEYKLLDDAMISKLDSLSKQDAHYNVGNLQRDIPGFSKQLLDKFTDIRARFIDANKLTSDQIVTVKKDAIFTIGRCNKTSFGKLTFIPKNVYSSYIRFSSNSNIEIFYYNNNLDIKGISETTLGRHRLYIMEFLRKSISMIESKDFGVKRYLRKLIDDYMSKELEEGYYLKFNNMSSDIDALFNLYNVIIPIVQIVNREMMS